MATITLDNVTRHYARQSAPAIHRVSLQINAGELLALLGASGSGKSTILKLIAGLDMPDDGDILFDGRSILTTPAHQRGAVLMFQKAYLFPFLTVAENISFGLKVQGLSRRACRDEVARMLDLVELPGFEQRYPAQLSGGEQQRIALARALVTQPRVLLLDEPLSNLDTAVRHNLQTVIRRIHQEFAMTTLLVTHDVSEAITLSDRTALLHNAHIVACEPPERFFHRPPTRAVARFVGVSTFFEGIIHGHTLQTGLGTLHLNGQSLPPDSHSLTVAIRPEHLVLCPEPDAPNTYPAIITDCVYKGEYTDYDVRIAESMFHVRRYQSTPIYAPGHQVTVQFPPDYLFVVAPDEPLIP